MTRLSVARIIGSIDNNVSYSSPYGPSEFNVSAPGSGCTNLNQSALPGNLNAMNVWEWIPADLAVLPPNSESSSTGVNLNNLLLSAGECVTGAANASANEEQRAAFLTGVLGMLQVFPGFDVLADTAAGIAIVANATYGCASFVGGSP